MESTNITAIDVDNPHHLFSTSPSHVSPSSSSPSSPRPLSTDSQTRTLENFALFENCQWSQLSSCDSVCSCGPFFHRKEFRRKRTDVPAGQLVQFVCFVLLLVFSSLEELNGVCRDPVTSKRSPSTPTLPHLDRVYESIVSSVVTWHGINGPETNVELPASTPSRNCWLIFLKVL